MPHFIFKGQNLDCILYNLAIKEEPVDQDFEDIGESSKEETSNLRTEEDIKPVVAEAMEAQEYDTRSEAEGSDKGLLNSDVEEEDENKDESGKIYVIFYPRRLIIRFLTLFVIVREHVICQLKLHVIFQ